MQRAKNKKKLIKITAKQNLQQLKLLIKKIQQKPKKK